MTRTTKKDLEAALEAAQARNQELEDKLAQIDKHLIAFTEQLRNVRSESASAWAAADAATLQAAEAALQLADAYAEIDVLNSEIAEFSVTVNEVADHAVFLERVLIAIASYDGDEPAIPVGLALPFAPEYQGIIRVKETD